MGTKHLELDSDLVNSFKTAVPLWGQNTWDDESVLVDYSPVMGTKHLKLESDLANPFKTTLSLWGRNAWN